MDDAAFADAMRRLSTHSEAIEVLLVELKGRSGHPYMTNFMPFWTAIVGDIEHHATRLVAAAQEVHDSYDRRQR